jgi:hypothetical protein
MNQLQLGSSPRGQRAPFHPASCNMQPAGTFVNYLYAIKITQQFSVLDITRIVFPLVARKPPHING